MAGDQRHLHDPAAAEKFARALGLMVGGHHPFVGDWQVKGLYAYRSGKYKGQAYFGTGGNESDRLKDTYDPNKPGESNQKYRPWNRDDPKIPEDIRQKLIRWEDKNSFKGGSHETTEASRVATPLRTGWYRIEHADGTLVERVRVHRDERKTRATNEFIATGDLTGDVTWYVEGNEVNVPEFGSTGTIQANGNIAWHRDGNKAVYEGNASNPSTGNQSIRHDGGKIALKSVHGKYLSAQPDGRAEWNRTVANDWEFFELGERDGRKITLRSTHGKYVSAQPDGTVQINRDHAPPGGWEEFTVETRPGSTSGDAHDCLHLKSVHGKYLSAQADGTVQWNRDHAPPGGWEDIQFVPQAGTQQASAAATRIQRHLNTGRSSKTASDEPIQILEAVAGQPVRFKLTKPPTSHEAWVGIYPPSASDQDHGAENNRWKWLRNIDVNNATFPKQGPGPQSIRVFADGGYTLHARKDFHVSSAEPADPAVVESKRKTGFMFLVIGMLLLAPSIPLLIISLGEGLSEGMSPAIMEIRDSDGRGDMGWGIYIEGSVVDFNSNGIFDHCENIIVNATHSGSWMSDPWTGYETVNPPDESRQVFEDYCEQTDPVEQRQHEGRNLIKIGTACYGCMAGTTTITAENPNGGEVVMWIQNEENKEILGLLIPSAIFMGIGGFMFVVSLMSLVSIGFKSNAPTSSKRSAGKAMGVGMTLFIMGLPLFIVGSITTGEGKTAMLVPGAVIFGIGTLILSISVVAVIRMGSTKGHSSVAGTGDEDGASTSLDVLLRTGNKEEVWMKEAEFDGQRLNGLIPDHRNNFSKKVTTSKIVGQQKVGNLTRFETGHTTYLVYDHDLQTEPGSQNPFW